MGYDFEKGRLDFSGAHPCSGGTADDSRIIARADEDNFLLTLYDTVHEVGHGCYTQGVPETWRRQPAGVELGMDIHESQSLMYEFQIGKSREFCNYIAGLAKDAFNRASDPTLSGENLHALHTWVIPNLVRIDMATSEVTYPLHILLRYRLEKELINGDLDPADLPERWADLSEEYFGRRPETPQEGVLQDVHWFCGWFGYFPTYVLGAMGSAQFYHAAVEEHPTIPQDMEKGDFSKLHQWRRENIHEKGRLLLPKDLFIAATGEPLNAVHYMNHLSTRYLGKPYEPEARSSAAAKKPSVS